MKSYRRFKSTVSDEYYIRAIKYARIIYKSKYSHDKTVCLSIPENKLHEILPKKFKIINSSDRLLIIETERKIYYINILDPVLF